MFENDTIILLITHTIAFIVGLAFDFAVVRPAVRTLLGETEKVTIEWAELVRVIVLFSMFLTFLAAIISSQFFEGNAPNLWLSLGGIFSFGSLIGERDFFARLMTALINKK